MHLGRAPLAGVIECGMRRFALVVMLVCSLDVPITSSASARIPNTAIAGSRLWVVRFDSRVAGIESASSVVTSPDGTMAFVVGTTWDGTTANYVTVAYRTSGGKELWRARRSGLHRSYLTTESLEVSPDGALVFISASVRTRSGSLGTATIAYQASTGALVWERHYAARPVDLAVSPDGGTVFVTGWVDDTFGSTDYGTVAYDASTGADLWEKTYGRDGTDSHWESTSAIAVSPDGSRVFVSGASSYDTVTLAYDASTGSRMWLARLRVVDGQEVTAMAVSPDGGRVFVAGETRRELAHWTTSTTVAYDTATGQEVWQTGSTAPRIPAYLTSMAVSPDSGIVYIAGRRVGRYGYFESVTTAFDASTGAKLWGRRYSGEGGWGNSANAVVASPDGSTVYVTGGTGQLRHADYATLAYDAVTGAELWVKQYQGPRDGYDSAHAIAITPDGTRVVVTGESEGATSPDYLTLAYSA
jgi:WD40 repeat protein